MTNEPAIANAIHHLANEIRLLTFGGASIDPTGQGAIEGLTLTVHDTGRDIASALSDIASAINRLADAVATSNS